MSICEWLKGKPPMVEQPTVPREDKTGAPVTAPPPQPPADNKPTHNLPDFSGSSKLRYPLLHKYDQDPDLGGTLVPKCVVWHHTVSYNMDGTVSWFKNNGVDIHFLVGHDGSVVQMAETNRKCAHAGASKWNGMNGLNDYAIGVEVINIGPLTKKGTKYFDAYDREWKGKVRERKGLGHTYWEPFTEAQEIACTNLAYWLVTVVGIPVSEHIAHYEASPGRKNDPFGGFENGDMEAQRAYWKTLFAKAKK